MLIKKAIESIGAPLGVGESWRGECPRCNRVSTFSITREPLGLLYNCYSAHCTLRGFLAVDKVSSCPPVRRQRVERPYDRPVVPCPPAVKAEILRRYGLDLDDAMARWNEDTRRVIFPVLGLLGQIRGRVARSFEGGVPKALSYPETQEPWQHWVPCRPGPRDVIVVEDILSAYRAADALDMRAVALLGSHMGTEQALEIHSALRGVDRRVVYIALDPDATDKAVSIASKYSLLFYDVRVLPLEEDIKDMTDSQLDSLRNRLRT